MPTTIHEVEDKQVTAVVYIRRYKTGFDGGEPPTNHRYKRKEGLYMDFNDGKTLGNS